MLLSIAFYSVSTMLVVGIANNVRKVLDINKQLKALREFENDLNN